MIAFYWFAVVVLCYFAVSFWAATVYKTFHRRSFNVGACLLLVPVAAAGIALMLPSGFRVIIVILLTAVVPALYSRVAAPSDDIIPRREIQPVLLHVVLISASVLFLIPFAWLLSTSLKSDKQMSVYPPVWFPHPALWANYPMALKFLPADSYFGLINLRNTLIIAGLSVVGTLLSSSLVAYGFARLKWPGRDWVFGLVLSTMMLPGAVTMMPQFLIFRSLHWVDTLLPLWVPSFFASAFNIFLLRQFFLGIPSELEDAAKMDGCNYFMTWWYVMIPMVKPALAAVAIMTFLGAWKDFMGPLIYISSPEKMPIAYSLQLYNTAHGNEPGLLMAATTMVLLPVIILFFFTQRYFIEGVTLTGLGGR